MPRLAIQGINSTFSSPDVCVVSPLEANAKLSESASARLEGNAVSKLRAAESSDSGAMTLCDGESSPIHSSNVPGVPSAFKSYSRSDSGEPSEYGILKSASGIVVEVDESNSSKAKAPNAKSYHILKELLMTERTTVFDLKLLVQDFYRLFPQQVLTSGRALSDFFGVLKPLYDFHRNLLNDLETKLTNWENSVDSSNGNAHSDQARVGDLLLCAVHNALHHYRSYVQQMPIFLAAIDELCRTSQAFSNALRSMEEESFCYLSINLLMLKIAHRMVVWQNALGRMVAALLEEGGDAIGASQLSNSRVALEKVASFNSETRATREGLTNFVKLVELENDLNGIDNLIQPNRKFVREGWLCRWSKKGLVPRIFVLFSDAFIFAYRSNSNRFTVNGFLPVRAMMFEDGDAYHVTNDATTCLTVYGGNRSLVLSANSTATKELWLEEITRAARIAKETKIEHLPRSATIKPAVSSDDLTTDVPANSDSNMSTNVDATNQNGKTSEATRQKESSKVTTLQVCWHRQATLGVDSLLAAPGNQLSGYLLRKFRNSPGWQRLWVVHSNFTLFFYKSHQDVCPLANLPLIDYHISLPALSDHINKENVFKLSYKAHFYFFRAESNYAFIRWIESMRQASLNSSPFDALTALISRFS
ncbi:FERM, RhoGEF and pleckstrin domain-containing protein 2 [Toxocara canis]|uniref:FERM, RhoGEF and pleckstrin domain-containing protein 2 n=1 Tax=Toxocara canis TaxID=6265 RepID=A0A0B2W0A7_TOXCA|nr:FERM, RhoGEF and pleckstrin domain-containing protein 2 [Toxocara canis]